MLSKNKSTVAEGRKSWLVSAMALGVYGRTKSSRIRSLLRKIVLKAEGGPMYSRTAREIFARFHGIEVGMYTIGPCEADPYRFPSGTRIGRYSSIYWTARIVADIEAYGASATNGFPSHSALTGKAVGTAVPTGIVIGHDVFVGHNAIIFTSAGQIGDGAFIGAGTVVQNPVPPFAVVMGNPARVVRYRFSEPKIKEISELGWWLKSLEELSIERSEFQKPLEGDSIM